MIPEPGWLIRLPFFFSLKFRRPKHHGSVAAFRRTRTDKTDQKAPQANDAPHAVQSQRPPPGRQLLRDRRAEKDCRTHTRAPAPLAPRLKTNPLSLISSHTRHGTTWHDTTRQDPIWAEEAETPPYNHPHLYQSHAISSHATLARDIKAKACLAVLTGLGDHLLQLVVLPGLLPEVRHHRHGALLDLPPGVPFLVHLLILT